MVTLETYWANIYVGCKDTEADHQFRIQRVEYHCQKHVDSVGLCVTVTPTKYIYTNGNETGVVVGLINYPRFPSSPEEIQAKALDLARILKKELCQHRVTVMFPDKTIMLGEDE